MDTLETAWSYGLAIYPRHAGSDALVAEPGFDPYRPADFQMLIDQWIPLSVALNSLNRSMGHDAAYPFALSPPVIDKLAFVHRVMHEAAPPAQLWLADLPGSFVHPASPLLHLRGGGPTRG